METFQNIRQFSDITYEKQNIDPYAKDLIERLLKKEPAERIGATDIEELKSHPFFRDIDWTTLRETKPPYDPPARFRKQQQNLAQIQTKRPKTSTSFIKSESPNSLNQSPNMSPMASPMKTGEKATVASFGGLKEGDLYSGVEEEKKAAVDPSPQSTKKYLRQGVLRKKGLIFMNEREVRIDSDGILTYYHFDKPGIPHGNIDLKHHMVQSIRIEYAGRRKQVASSSNRNSSQAPSTSKRPIPNVDDEIRIYMRNKESDTFIFRASKLKNSNTTDNPSIESWERTIRKFAKKVHVV